MKNPGAKSSTQPNRISPTTLTIGILVCLLLSVTTWAILAQRDVSSLEDELATVRANANARSYTMEATDTAPANASGQVFLSVNGTGVITVTNLPRPGDNEVYRVWYMQDDGSAVGGGTIPIDDAGHGFALVPGDSGDYAGIAISLEPSDAEEPGGSFLLEVYVDSGRG